MRSRKTRPSDGVLNGRYGDRHRDGGTSRHYGAGRSLLVLATVVLLFLWITVGFCASSASHSDQGWCLVRLWRTVLNGTSGASADSKLVGSTKSKHKEKKKSKHHHGKHDLPECTPSPLEKREAYPLYGCAEIEEMLQGDTTFLGQGYWREVRLARYEGRDVALKTLRDTQEETQRNLERHRWEAAALDAVRGHPNIVHLLGLCECDMVTEYFPVYMDEKLLVDSSDSSEVEQFPDHEIIQMALDAARGLQALHEIPGGPVVHADLQPRQLLIDEDGVVKLNDLNRCRFMGRDEHGDPCPFRIKKGNGVWRSPEEYSGELQTEKLDIYSMGMIFWAMYGRRPPFVRDDLYKRKVLKGERPRVDPSWHKGFVELFQEMWVRTPEDRPTAGEVVARLEAMLAVLPADSR